MEHVSAATVGDLVEMQEAAFDRVDSQDPLAPGHYWRVRSGAVGSIHDRSGSLPRDLVEGDLHLIVDLFFFEDSLHSIIFLEHPRYASRRGEFSRCKLLAAEFLSLFEPVNEAEAKRIRAAEQSELMEQMAQIQRSMHEAQTAPLAVAGIKDAADEAIERFERAEAARIQAEEKDRARRDADLRKLHRRAARRSEVKGNPLVVRRTTISDRLDVMIADGITQDDVQELQFEAGRRLAVANATAKWLEAQTDKLSRVLERLTPYFAEQGQLARAVASGAINRVKEIGQGIRSLNLYLGTGVDVVTVREGADAPETAPLALMQLKLAMDEELAVHIDVADDFDCSSAPQFFERLKNSDELLRQVLPTPRCVVSMMTTRRSIDYDSRMDPWERLQRDIANRRVFLLVRNGGNVHVVYSGEPSHEAAERLFPSDDDIKAPFRGLDGSAVGLQDVAFGPASKKFDDQALHYRRFLILLCGLDHRMDLFGKFCPEHKKMAFMSLDFQRQYMRFVENDSSASLIGPQTSESVFGWMQRHNSALRSGSRVVVDSNATLVRAIPYLHRSHSMRLDVSELKEQNNMLIATERGGHYCLSAPTQSTVQSGKTGTATVWLNGPDAYKSDGWWLCIDRVKLSEVRHYIYNRTARFCSIAWLRTLRRVEAYLVATAEQEAALRAYLRRSALEARVGDAETVDEAIDIAVAAWRADNRGASAPAVEDGKRVAQLLSVLVPAQSLADGLQPIAEDLCSRKGWQPLLLTRSGKNQWRLYVEVPPAEREPYSAGVLWGWVKCVRISVRNGKAAAGHQSLIWLQAHTLQTSQEEVVRWPQASAWIHPEEQPEPCRPSELIKARDAIEQGNATVMRLYEAAVARQGIPQDLFHAWKADAVDSVKKLTYTQNVYVTLALGLIQTRSGQLQYVYARAGLIDLVRCWGLPWQLKDLMDNRGFRSSYMRGVANSTAPLVWTTVVSKDLVTRVIAKDGDLGEFRGSGKWSLHNTHEKGGVKTKMRRETRAERRAANGMAQVSEVTVTLSWSRRIDQLMGVAPLARRACYKALEERVRDVRRDRWSNEAEKEKKIKALRKERFTPAVPRAAHLAEVLWDSRAKRSNASRYFSGRSTLIYSHN